MTTPNLTATRPDYVNLSAVMAALTAAGVPVTLYHSGGGVFTIGVGDMVADGQGDDRYPVLIGPVAFRDDDGTEWGAIGDLYIGPDDDGTYPDMCKTIAADMTPAALAEMTADMVPACAAIIPTVYADQPTN